MKKQNKTKTHQKPVGKEIIYFQIVKFLKVEAAPGVMLV